MMEREKIIFIDIETTSLFSSNGTIVCIGLFDPENFTEPSVYFVRNPSEEKNALGWMKSKIIEHGYNAICGWNIKKFDIPFIVGRALKLDIDFSELNNLIPIDLMEICKNIFRLHSYRQEDVCKWLGISNTNNISGWMIDDIYHKALTGDKEAEEKIKLRCQHDLTNLYKIFQKIKPYLRLQF